ncbi:DUF202 domain-containing protein [Pseudarthrobacter sp. H2]|uniref:DUF202 domain-containing protein n=1 Tax=Pseudarthrobacter sp. H2 TaxID=3418415 RepID=UPI003CEDF57D
MIVVFSKGRRNPEHGDAGLQPERTDLAWGRTTMAMTVVAAIFLRWMPHHGWFIGVIVAATVLTSFAMKLTQQRRYTRAVLGINAESMRADVMATMSVSAAVVILAGLGIYTVLYLPLHP